MENSITNNFLSYQIPKYLQTDKPANNSNFMLRRELRTDGLKKKKTSCGSVTTNKRACSRKQKYTLTGVAREAGLHCNQPRQSNPCNPSPSVCPQHILSWIRKLPLNYYCHRSVCKLELSYYFHIILDQNTGQVTFSCRVIWSQLGIIVNIVLNKSSPVYRGEKN